MQSLTYIFSKKMFMFFFEDQLFIFNDDISNIYSLLYRMYSIDTVLSITSNLLTHNLIIW